MVNGEWKISDVCLLLAAACRNARLSVANPVHHFQEIDNEGNCLLGYLFLWDVSALVKLVQFGILDIAFQSQACLAGNNFILLSPDDEGWHLYVLVPGH